MHRVWLIKHILGVNREKEKRVDQLRGLVSDMRANQVETFIDRIWGCSGQGHPKGLTIFTEHGH